jgi:Ca2+-binding RTX toxin-like protein
VSGDDGRDIAWGGRGRDTLEGGGGGDLLHAGRGPDVLEGSNGRDILRAVEDDGQPDVLDCGPGRDRAVLRAGDVAVDCERVRILPAS